jgi:hypothetical protein
VKKQCSLDALKLQQYYMSSASTAAYSLKAVARFLKQNDVSIQVSQVGSQNLLRD